MSQALLLVDHGSRRSEANQMLEGVADMLRHKRPGLIVHIAHMELAEPTITQGVQACVQDGATSIVIHPYMLSPGRHATQDIPKLVKEAAQAFPELKVTITEPLGLHDKLADIVLERAGL